MCGLLFSVRDTHGGLEKVAEEERAVLLVGPAHEGEPSLSFFVDVCVCAC